MGTPPLLLVRGVCGGVGRVALPSLEYLPWSVQHQVLGSMHSQLGGSPPAGRFMLAGVEGQLARRRPLYHPAAHLHAVGRGRHCCRLPCMPDGCAGHCTAPALFPAASPWCGVWQGRLPLGLGLAVLLRLSSGVCLERGRLVSCGGLAQLQLLSLQPPSARCGGAASRLPWALVVAVS